MGPGEGPTPSQHQDVIQGSKLTSMTEDERHVVPKQGLNGYDVANSTKYR